MAIFVVPNSEGTRIDLLPRDEGRQSIPIYYTIAPILLVNIIMCSKFHYPNVSNQISFLRSMPAATRLRGTATTPPTPTLFLAGLPPMLEKSSRKRLHKNDCEESPRIHLLPRDEGGFPQPPWASFRAFHWLNPPAGGADRAETEVWGLGFRV